MKLPNYFLCQLTCNSMVSAYASVGTSPPKVEGPETCCRKIHDDLSICLFARAIRREVPPPTVWKFQHFIILFFSLTIERIFLVSCTCNRLQEDSLV